ncbi:MAG: hydroxymethylbilane synthase [Planctomycetota bacterium]|nr:MAG: hydroxymethylbilane synthase [Planctomycetota bacterium]
MGSRIVIGTRGSRLALWQANHVARLLEHLATVQVVEIETAGDQVRDVPLAQIGGEGVFTKELDLPTVPVEGLLLAAVPERGPAGDVFISHRYANFDSLAAGATVATSSLRRRAQMLHRRPDLRVVNIRGNVETRLRKLSEESYDALVLAQAGLERLGLAQVITEILIPQWMLPAVGQGALGLECRADDAPTRNIVRQVNHPATYQAVLAERSLLRALQGGCQVPVGASATVHNETLTLRATVLDPDGKKCIQGQIAGTAAQAELLGQQLARELLARGADHLLRHHPA